MSAKPRYPGQLHIERTMNRSDPRVVSAALPPPRNDTQKHDAPKKPRYMGGAGKPLLP